MALSDFLNSKSFSLWTNVLIVLQFRIWLLPYKCNYPLLYSLDIIYFILICHQQITILVIYFCTMTEGFNLVNRLNLIILLQLLFRILWYYFIDFELILCIPHSVFIHSLSLWHMLSYGKYIFLYYLMTNWISNIFVEPYTDLMNV